MKKQIATVVIFSTHSILCFATDSCNSLLNVGLYNTTQSSNANDAQYLATSTFCQADYSKIDQNSSQALAINAAYGLFSGGLSGSNSSQSIVAKQSQLCTSGFNSNSYSNNASNYSKTIYQGALDAWNKCQQLSNQGLIFSVQPSSTMQGITVSMTAPPGYSATYYGVTQFGSGTSTCTTMANGKILTPSTTDPFKFDAGNKIIVTCKRNMEKYGEDLSADAQDLVFVTSSDNLTVPMAPIGKLSRISIEKISSDLLSKIDSRLMPVGSIIAFAGDINKIPKGWLLCDGSEVNRSHYAELFDVIKTHHGNGDMINTFNLPDYRGRFLRGVDHLAGRDKDSASRTKSNSGGNHGNMVGSVQEDQFASHEHSLQWWANGGMTLPNIYPGIPNSYNPLPNQASSKGVGTSGGSETRPKNAYVNFLIKY